MTRNEYSYGGSEHWRQALDVAADLKAAAEQLELAAEKEWLRHVMNEAADQMRSSVLWAASAPAQQHESLRHYVVAADAARSDAVVASYFLNFMRSERLINEGTAARVGSELQQVESNMDSLSRRLRSDLGLDPYGFETTA